jgi:peptide/nickel transport system permease protein
MTAVPLPYTPAVPVARTRWRLGVKIWIGLSIVGIYVLVALLAPLLAPYNPMLQDPLHALLGPSAHHWLGTDELGRDELSRIFFAARIDLPVAAFGALLPCLLGTVLGALAGFAGRWADVVVMRVADLVQAFPIYILMIALVFALGPGVRSLLIAFTAVGWVVYARLIRGEIFRIRDLDYVSAALVGGLSKMRILVVHVLPIAIRQTIIYVSSDLVFAMLALASFSFLGLGIPPPTAEWGAMISAGQDYISIAWWLTVFPGVALTIIALGLALIGDGVHDRLTS